MTLSHDETDALVEQLTVQPFGEGLCALLVKGLEPAMVGFSVMWSAQVIPALILSRWVKYNWPATRVVWGGPHVTALAGRIAADSRYGRWVDGFLPQHCEDSFVLLVESVRSGGFAAPGLIVAGQGRPREAPLAPLVPPVPEFGDLALYGRPRLVIPAQLSRGCAYARCTFCTYPAMEGEYTPLSVDHLEQTVDLAVCHGGYVSLKDSLVTTERLAQVAHLVGGRVGWSACTKLHPSLDSTLLEKLAVGGCRTLEVGLETVDPEMQRLIDKPQPLVWLQHFLRGAEEAGISVVVNYITGFPGEDLARAERQLAWLRQNARTFPRLNARVEHNRFQLERLSPMAQNPAKYGVRIAGEWPWSSILLWEPLGAEVREPLELPVLQPAVLPVHEGRVVH